MPIQSIEDMALSEIPDLDGTVVAAGKQISSIRVESNLVYSISVGVIVLKESVGSDVPDLDGLVIGGTCNTGPIRMELHVIHAIRVIRGERVNQSLLREVPKLHTSVIRA